ncbi:MAG: hypothetical protein ABIK92_00450 [Pseudomonadota bacterium]
MMDCSRSKKLECYTGYLKKSPCRDCEFKNNLPDCFDDCKLLKQLQIDMASVISCSNDYSEVETYSMPSLQP